MTNTDPQPQTPPGRKGRLSTSAKAALIVIPTVLAAALILFIVLAAGNADRSAGSEGSGVGEPIVPLVSGTSRVLGERVEGGPTLVEFLDFECEACGEIYPVMEDIREQYEGQVNFVVRYFPIPGHLNSMTSAIAVEAAAQQGKFEEMYQLMFETQAEWGEKQESEAPRFRGFAADLGLDMIAYDAAVADPATQQRVEYDFEQGQQLGVTGTPSFFFEDRPFTPQYVTDITDALDAALKE